MERSVVAEEKLVDVREGYTGAGSDAWFWFDVLAPDDDLRPLWETIPSLPAGFVAAKAGQSAEDPLDKQRRRAEGTVALALYGIFGRQWRKLKRQLLHQRRDLLALRQARQAAGLGLAFGLDWGQEEARMVVSLAPALNKVIATAGRLVWQELGEMGVQLSWDVYDRAARQWALKYRYDLVTRINASTREQLGKVMARWIASDEDFGQLTERVWKVVPTNPYPHIRDRAQLIAQTEMTRVYAESRIAGLKEAGYRRMVWQTANDELVCTRVCAPLHDREGSLEMGVLNPLNGRYYKPPAHPSCRCSLTASPAELEARAGMKPYPVPAMPGEAAKAYDPDQPRAPKGSEIGGRWISGPDAGKGATREQIAKAFAERNGLPAEWIVFSKTNKSIGGYATLAECVFRSGYDTAVHVYPKAPREQKALEAILAHEFVHALTYQQTGVVVKHLKRHAGEAAWDARGWQAMSDPGRFTPYLELVWDEFQAGNLSGKLAFNEVLAEIGRLRYLGEYHKVPFIWKQVYEDIMNEVRQ